MSKYIKKPFTRECDACGKSISTDHAFCWDCGRAVLTGVKDPYVRKVTRAFEELEMAVAWLKFEIRHKGKSGSLSRVDAEVRLLDAIDEVRKIFDKERIRG